MKISTESFRKFDTVAELFSVEENQRSQKLYLSFSDSFVYLFNPSFAGRFKFNFELEDGETLTDFSTLSVELEKFLMLCKQYAEISLDKKFNLTCGKDTFKLASSQETFDILDFDTTGFKPYTLSEATKSAISESKTFVGLENVESNYAGIALSGNKVVSTDGFSVYYQEVEGNDFPSIQLSKKIVSIIDKASHLPCNLYLDDKDSHFLLGIADDSFMVISTLIDNLRLPDFEAQDWAKTYRYPTSFSMEGNVFFNLLPFLSPFVDGIRNKPLFLTVEDETTLVVEAKGDSIARKIIPLVSCSNELVGANFIVMLESVKKALALFKKENVIIHYSDEAPVFTVTGSETTNTSVIIVAMTE